ncbi:hypothetical protein P5V15_009102 [Pogonomyrmex californicus]
MEIEMEIETVTLILKGIRFRVSKQKLIRKSQFFAVLLSKNYIDYHKTEHTILYDIPINMMKMFLYWIEYNYLPPEKTERRMFNNLYVLLEISVLFATDELIEHITYIFERRYMTPEYLLDIWLHAEELGIKVLRDLSLLTSLDRFVELPLDSLFKLEKSDFLKLIGNINITCTKGYLNQVIKEWADYNKEEFPINIIKKTQKNTFQAIITSENSNINSDFSIYCWDGKEFFKFTSFKYPKGIIGICNRSGPLKGERIVARGYNLYLLGGQYTCDGSYNKYIWRYSLISKKWFRQTVMPIKRKDMIATFVKTKLIILAGIGEYGGRVNSVDIYDVHTDTWIEDEFSHIWRSNTKHFVINGILYIFDKNDIGSYISIYSSELGYWQYLNFSIFNPFCSFINQLDIPEKTPLLTFDNARCHLDTKKRVLNVACNMKDCKHVDFKYISKMDEISSVNPFWLWRKHIVKNKHRLNMHLTHDINFFEVKSSNNKKCIKETLNLPIIACCNSKFDWDLYNRIKYSFDNLHLHCIPLHNLPSLYCKSEFFDLMDLNQLHTSLLEFIN